MWSWLKALAGAPLKRDAALVPDDLWQALLISLPFIAALNEAERADLRGLAADFLADKEFQGAGGLVITDAMALSIAAQACLPLLHLGPPPARPRADRLAWYADFVGIVVHPGEVVARREAVDDATGVVHQYDEVLSGEAMDGGPVMLSWDEVARAGDAMAQGTNVVIHEFVHKIVMQGPHFEHAPGGCPPLPKDFLGTDSARAAVDAWFAVLQPAFDGFREKVIIAERFGGAPTWLDPYGAESIDEFFPVACEAYFVNRARFEQSFPALMPIFDGFFRQAGG
ncbi:hypothetical protein RD110_12180 [Rhodoferax koreense]|uniref:Zinc-dependent peptidase n=1 Tax=Rhodoferax koreensis TaxID=1842727 RepID=A0A1P8JVT6_9BURK|nr:M90 family metallopeptidase [Rhodoferax koreense]APW37862.1 hypothetical protein RD110_12180 [Rhodoferax koreense]